MAKRALPCSINNKDPIAREPKDSECQKLSTLDLAKGQIMQGIIDQIKDVGLYSSQDSLFDYF